MDQRARAVLSVPAEPYEFELDPPSTALVIIDMQRDFLDPGGFGEQLGNDVNLLRSAISPLRKVLDAWRAAGLAVIYTREGHRPDLADCPPTKRARGRLACRIGDQGPMGRILIRGSYGHGIIDQLAPVSGEVIVDKPGKGAFFATDLDLLLHNLGIHSLVIGGVTTEVCVTSTVHEANDRGYECLVLADCVGSYFPDFHRSALEMITAQAGIFGWVTDSATLLTTLGNHHYLDQA